MGAAVAAGYLLTARQTVAFTEFVMGTQTAFACLFGLAAVTLALRERPLPVAVLTGFAVRAVVTSGNVSLAARHTEIQDPCVTVHQPFPVNAGFVRRLKTAYGLPDPDCTQPAAERFLEDTTDEGL